jgi:hypothetical protein
MDIHFLEEEWFWAAAAVGFAAVSCIVSVFALSQSSKALRVDIPAPEVNWGSEHFVSVQMREGDQQRFGIAEIRPLGGTLRHVKVEKEDPYGGYFMEPALEEHRRMTYMPSVAHATLYVFVPAGSGIKVKVVSRAEASVSAWIEFTR